MISIRALRTVALLEATSFLILLYFSVISRNDELIDIVGPIHGVLFMAFLAEIWLLRESAGFTGMQTIWLVAAAVVPFGGYVADWWLARRYVAPVG